MRLYVLDGHTPLPVDDLEVWGPWMASADRCVAETTIGEVRISTVFLGLDYEGREPPLLFETMVFGGPPHTARYSTWEDAEVGHAAAVARVSATF